MVIAAVREIMPVTAILWAWLLLGLLVTAMLLSEKVRAWLSESGKAPALDSDSLAVLAYSAAVEADEPRKSTELLGILQEE
jgi:hypothetical protein